MSYNLEDEIWCFLHPVCFQHTPYRISSGLGRGTEGAKVMCADQWVSGITQVIEVNCRPNEPGIWFKHRIPHRLAVNSIKILTPAGIETWVERSLNLLYFSG